MKRKNLGRKIALLLAAIFVLSSMPTYVYAEDSQDMTSSVAEQEYMDSEQDDSEAYDENAGENSDENAEEDAESTVDDEYEEDAESTVDDEYEEDEYIVDEYIADEEYIVEDECVGATVDASGYFKMPYVSTYYFNPKPSINDNIQIPIYITDYEQSEYLNNDASVTLDIIYEVDGVSRTINNVPLGNYTLTIGQLSEGKHIVAIQTYDKRNGLKSHKLYNDLWVINPATYEISAEQIYYMTEEDLAAYKINNQNSSDETDLVNTREGLSKLFADKQEKGFRKIVLVKGTYRING